MTLGALLFVVAVLVTVTVAVPVSLAALVQRQSPAAVWLRRQVRWFWGAAAVCSLASLVLKLADGSAFAQLDVVVSALVFMCTVSVALLRPPGAAQRNLSN